MRKRGFEVVFYALLGMVFLSSIVGAADSNTYVSDVYFTVSDSVYSTGERIELKGALTQANYTSNGTLVSSLSALASTLINITINHANSSFIANYSLTTDVNGSFYSGSTFYSGAKNISAPSNAGEYSLRAEYRDPNSTRWFSEVSITVVNKTLDIISISPEKASYNPSESVKINLEAIRTIGDSILRIANVSLNGSLRNQTKSIIQQFNCTTGENGMCSVNVSAPSTYGKYFVEAQDYKSFSSFYVVPFSYSLYMKDELGKSLKNIYAIGEQARVEVSIANASTSDVYTFSGSVTDSSGNVVKSISSTTLNSNNTFKNTFLFTVDALSFSYGAYGVSVTISKTGDGSITTSSSIQVQDWALAVEKKTVGAGFEYGYSIFPSRTAYLEAFPKYRVNGSVVPDINVSFFSVRLKDSLNNILSSSSVTWNSTCGKEGCYQFSFTSPSNAGRYYLTTELAYSGATQVYTKTIEVVTSVVSAQTTNKDGALKELFGANEYAYLSLTARNQTTSSINLSDATLALIRYMNGSEISYTQVSSFDLVNVSNSNYEWAWNSSSQRIKLDVPNSGGVYTALVYGNNDSAGTYTRFIVNPYDVCIVAKDTPGTVSSGYYYVWQFKTTDTVYFEIKPVRASNPLGKAPAQNFSSNSSTGSSYGKGSQCVIDSNTQQVVSNASISVIEVRNMESGAMQNINTSSSVCQSTDTSGGYSCTVQPSEKWESGQNVVQFRLQGQDGTVDVAHGNFEARAFYLYGWSSNWQNGPNSNITLNMQIYQAGNGWWGSGSGKSGTLTLKRVEYMGTDGEWIWPPVNSGYNVSNVSTANVGTSGSGTLSIPVSAAPNGIWRSGNYRAIIQGTTTEGDTDYGYAWFGIKRWDVYGQPIECLTTRCDYKSYFNSRENITLFVKISKAGNYNYNDNGGSDIGGNVTISVKKIQDCRTWPCTELNTSKYSATSIRVNASSGWYWNTNLGNSSTYLIYINSTSSAGYSWNTGYYSVVLDVNGTDTGNAWFNTIAFYADTRPTDNGGTNYVYSIKSRERMYYNVSVTKNYKGWGSLYNDSDYLNASVTDVTLHAWDSSTQRSKNYNYPEDINITIVGENDTQIEGNDLLNISYLNGSWPSGYYWGDMVLTNAQNETSSAWLWFDAKPFRVSSSVNSYSVDTSQCVNGSLDIYEPKWNANTYIYSNYSIISVSENIWSGSSNTVTSYTNRTVSSFNATTNATFCPNNGDWGSGSWGGWHYLNVVVKDTNTNETETGWLSFKAMPFSISWGSVQGGSNKLITENAIVPVTITRNSDGASVSGNLTKVYQWRWDSGYNGKQEYIFKVGSCFSNVSGQCTVNGTQNVTIYAPSGGWRNGYNYLQTEWSPVTSSSVMQDYSGIYIEGRSVYNGYYDTVDTNGNWKYNFAPNESLTFRVNVRNSSYDFVDATISSVSYSLSSNCWDEWCRSYTSASWSLVEGGTTVGSDGKAIVVIPAPSGNWTKGYYSFKTTVTGSGGTASITGGQIRVKDSTAPVINITSPVNNQSVILTSFLFNATTNENSRCDLRVQNYDNFNSYYCGGWNTTNNGTVTAQRIGACNTTKYLYSGSSYSYEYVSDTYRSRYNSTDSSWSSGSTGLVTGGTAHSYTFNITNWTGQYYGIQAWCWDNEDNYANEIVALRANWTG